MNNLSYCPDPIKKNNCLSETELASGKVPKSCEIILEVVFLVEWVECTINFIPNFLDYSYYVLNFGKK